MNDSINAVRSIILADPTLAERLTDGEIKKVRRGKAAQTDQLPYVLLWKITDRPVHHLGGKTGTRNGVVQVDVYAKSGAEAGEIAGLIGDAIARFGRGYTGKSASGENDNTLFVNSILEEDTHDNDQGSNEGAEKDIAVVQTDYRLFYQPTT